METTKPTTRQARRAAVVLLGGGAALAVLGVVGSAGVAGAAPASGASSAPAAKQFAPPSPALQGGSRAHARPAATAHATSTSVTDSPGNVYDIAPPPRLVPSPTSDPADLVAASASDDGTTITFTAQAVSNNDPFTDPNWVNGDTYIGWQIAPGSSPSTTPTYDVYFSVSTSGAPAGVLVYEPSSNPVSCTVNLAYSATTGYQASFAASCLPGMTTFEWNAYSNYDLSPESVDPNGYNAFGKALPDTHTGGAEYAAAVTAPGPAPVAAAGGSARPTYWLFGQDGGVFSFNSPFYGSVPGAGVHVSNVMGGTTTLDHRGYWMVGSDGGVYAFGDARFYGSMGGTALNSPVVGMTNEPTGNGYWLVAKDGGVFAFGGAGYFGSMGGDPLSSPMAAIAAPDDGGYWMVGQDGGVFAFGDAGYFGSLPALGVKPSGPIVGLASTADGKGYWMVSAQGAVYAFGDATYFGSMAGTPLVGPMVGMVSTPDGGGYWLVASDGGVFSYGDTNFYGSLGGHPRQDPIVAMAVSS